MKKKKQKDSKGAGWIFLIIIALGIFMLTVLIVQSNLQNEKIKKLESVQKQKPNKSEFMIYKESCYNKTRTVKIQNGTREVTKYHCHLNPWDSAVTQIVEDYSNLLSMIEGGLCASASIEKEKRTVYIEYNYTHEVCKRTEEEQYSEGEVKRYWKPIHGRFCSLGGGNCRKGIVGELGKTISFSTKKLDKNYKCLVRELPQEFPEGCEMPEACKKAYPCLKWECDDGYYVEVK
jgi:hypothetical protein